VFERLVKAFFNLGPCDAAVVAKATEAFHRDARVLDAHLANQPYLVGTGVTLADFSVAAPLFYTEKAELPLTSYPHIRDGSPASPACPPGATRRPPPPQPDTAPRSWRGGGGAPSSLQATAQTRHGLTFFLDCVAGKFPAAVVFLDRRRQGREATPR
jgi:Glutathione S-transferase, C-terminal domain